MLKLDYDYKTNKEYITYYGKRIAEVLDEYICKDIVEDFNYLNNRERDYISKHKISELSKNIAKKVVLDFEYEIEDSIESAINNYFEEIE